MSVLATTSEQDLTRYASKAAGIYRNLLALDSHEKDRQQLLDAGIARHTVLALYPANLARLVPGIVRNLGYDLHHALLSPKIVQVALMLPPVIRKLPINLQAQFEQDLDLRSSQAYPQLAYPELHRTLVQVWKMSEFDAKKLTLAIWHTYWLMSHRDQLPEPVGEFADLLMIELAGYVLRDLIPAE